MLGEALKVPTAQQLSVDEQSDHRRRRRSKATLR
jgi:hypothetical protein